MSCSIGGYDNLANAVYHYACKTPKAPAVVFNGEVLTFGELAARAASLAITLGKHSDWKIPTDHPPRVGLLASRSLDACIALLGACWAGATYIPISLKQPEERIQAIIQQCDLTAVITDAEGQTLLTPSLRAKCPTIVLSASEADKNIVLTPPVPMRTDDIAYIIFTSGSTGAPKGVMISLASVRHYLSTIVAWLGLTSGDRALETCELSFDFSVHNMFSIWEAGASLHILPATRVMNAVKFARSSELTVWNSVPSLAGMLLQVKALPQDSLAGLRLAVFGGEQLPLGVVEAFQQAAPHCTIANLYGPTEATVFCTAQRVEKSLPLPASRDVVAIGSPLPGNKVRIVDEKGDEVTPGTSGELLIGGVQLAAGYLGQTELTAQRFPIINDERWYRSGDLALQDKDGRYHCLGRIDNQVKVLGYRVELEEIDAHLRRVVGAALVGSVAWPVLDGMARGIVSFVGAISVEAEAIKKELVQHIPSYMIPHRIIALEHMPLNASGKVDRNALLNFLGHHDVRAA